MLGYEARELLRDQIRRGLVFHGEESELDPSVNGILVMAPDFTYAWGILTLNRSLVIIQSLSW